MSCEDCKWYDVSRGVGNNIPKDAEGNRVDFCGYHEVAIPDVEKCECSHYVNIFDEFMCKACAECTKETEGQCPPIMCRNCATCSLKWFGTCHYSQCHDCGYCEYFDDHCYQDTWRESWDIYLVERYHNRFIREGDQ